VKVGGEEQLLSIKAFDRLEHGHNDTKKKASVADWL
jgi:hypothetical protein